MRRDFFIIIVIIAVILQALLAKEFKVKESSFFFLEGVPFTTEFSMVYKYLMIWYLPLIMVSFFFSGRLYKRIHHQGIAIFIRSYSKKKWLLKQFCSMIIAVFFIVFLQCLIFILTDHSIKFVLDTSFLYSFLMYMMMVSSLICLQYCLELIIRMELANLILNIYIVSSVLMSVYLNHFLNWISYLLIPNYGMGFRNSLSEGEGYNQMLNGYIAFSCLLIIHFAAYMFAMQKLKRMDIL